MNTEILAMEDNGFNVVATDSEELPQARLIIDVVFHDNDGEFLGFWSDDYPPLVIPIEKVSAQAVWDAILNQKEYRISGVGLEDIQKWLAEGDCFDNHLTLNECDYVPYKGWSDPNPGSVEGTELLFAQLETFEQFVEWEVGSLKERFIRSRK